MRAGPLERLAALAGGGAVLMMTARFGRSPVREAAYRLCAQHRSLDLKPSWRLFTSLADWGNRWPAEQGAFAAGLILSADGEPVVERAVGRCLADLAGLGRPLLWGVASRPVRWCPRFMMNRNGWPPNKVLPDPAAYARLTVADDTTEFTPRFDPILYATEPDFSVRDTRLRWFEARHFIWFERHG
jgi:hypothetical protein